jgi:hypothetical protein
MASTFNNNLRLEMIGTGDQAGVWGDTTNVNLGGLLVDAIAGYTSISITTQKYALTANDGVADQSRNAAIAFTTTYGAAYEAYVPPVSKMYVIYNADPTYALTVYNSSVLGNTTAGGTGVTIPVGKTATVWSDGTNVKLQNTYFDAPTINTPTLTGTPLAPTATAKTATTQVATTAFTDAMRGFLTSTTTTTAVLTDRGCLLPLTAGITIPASVFALNDAFTIFNNSGSNITITQGSGLTMYWAGPATTGNRTLAGRGLCTVVFVSATVCVISGAGVS